MATPKKSAVGAKEIMKEENREKEDKKIEDKEENGKNVYAHL